VLRLFRIEHAFRRIANHHYAAQKSAHFDAQRACATELAGAIAHARKATDCAPPETAHASRAKATTYSAQGIDTDKRKGCSTECRDVIWVIWNRVVRASGAPYSL